MRTLLLIGLGASVTGTVLAVRSSAVVGTIVGVHAVVVAVLVLLALRPRR